MGVEGLRDIGKGFIDDMAPELRFGGEIRHGQEETWNDPFRRK